MNNIWRLYKVMIKGSGGRTGKRKWLKRIFLILLLLMAFTPFAMMFGAATISLYMAYAPLGKETLALVLPFGFAVGGMFVFSFLQAVTMFCFADDEFTFAYLPVKKTEIAAARFMTLLTYQYYIAAVTLIPIFAGFAMMAGSGLVYTICCILSFLLIPVGPVACAVILGMLFARIPGINKNKDRFRIFAGVFGLILAAGVNIVIREMHFQSAEQMVGFAQGIESGSGAFLPLLSVLGPGSRFAAQALAAAHANAFMAAVYMLALLLVSAATIALAVVLASGHRAMPDLAVKKRRGAGAIDVDYAKGARLSSPMTALVRREIIMLLRTPEFFLNCVIMNFIWPVFFLAVFFVGGDAQQSLGKLAVYLSQPAYMGRAVVGVAATILFAAGSNRIAATAVSREGKSFWFVRQLPVSPAQYVLSKLIPAWTMGGVAVLAIAVVLPFVGASAGLIFLAMLIGFPALVLVGIIGLFLDMHAPKLEWDNPAKAVKQNMNAMIAGVLAMLIAAAIALPEFIGGFNPFGFACVAALILCALSALLLWILVKKTERCLAVLG